MKHHRLGKVELDTKPELESGLDTLFFSIVTEREPAQAQSLFMHAFGNSWEVPEDYEDGKHVFLKWSQKHILAGLGRDLVADPSGIVEAVFEHAVKLQHEKTGPFELTDRAINTSFEGISGEVDSRLGRISMLLVVLDPRSASYPEVPN